MLTRPIVYDGLWRCLCPFSASQQATIGLATARSRAAVHNNQASRATTQIRTLTSDPFPPSESTPYLSPGAFKNPKTSNRSQIPPRTSLSNRPGPKTSTHEASPGLVHLPTAELYDRLRRFGTAGKHDDVMAIVRILIKDRRERPDVRMYTAVIHSFVNPEEGTAGKVRRVLDEMTESGVELDAWGCHCVLEALAVHPDYLLRNEILEYMTERWWSLNDRGHNMVVAGLLRDKLFEMALEKVQEMVTRRVKVEDWLWDKLMWLLLDYGEMEECYQVLLLRQNNGSGKLNPALWMQFLDKAAGVHHFEAISLTWQTQVIPNYLKPATGTCLKILTLAGRRGDVKFATEVFRVLSDRDTVFDIHTYEGLMEAYITSLDLAAALSVAIIMHESGLKVTADSIGPIYFFLVQDPDRPMEAFNMLRNFEAKGRKVPVAAVNVCLQASVHLRRLEEAIEIYKALHTVVKSGPNTDTFNILFQGCHRAARKELAMFLASEMTQIGLKPNRITYDRLVLVCVQSGDLDDAMLYYEEMRGQGWGMRRGTFEAVIWRGIEVGDVRMVGVLREMREAGFEPREELVKGVKARFEDAPLKNAVEGTEEGLTVPVVDAMSGIEGRVIQPVVDAFSGIEKKPFEVVRDLLSGHEDMHVEPSTRKASTDVEGVFTGSSPDSLRSANVKKPVGRVIAEASTVLEESLAEPVQEVLLASGDDKAVAAPVQNAVSEIVAAEKGGKKVTDTKAGEVEEKRPEENKAAQQDPPEQAFQKTTTGEDSVKP